jgi:fatty-acyl-CoA synthase
MGEIMFRGNIVMKGYLLAHFKAPRRIVFGPLPKTSTAKIQKFILREQVKSTGAIA